MKYLFTPGAQRAVIHAAAWTTNSALADLDAPAILLGLLEETECRAAGILARYDICANLVRRRWPELTRHDSPSAEGTSFLTVADSISFSADIETSLQQAQEVFADYPQPLQLATEHVLLGLVLAEHETSTWLRQRGIDPRELETEIHGFYGHEPGPMVIDLEEPLPLSPEEQEAPTMTDVLAEYRQADKGANEDPHSTTAPLSNENGPARMSRSVLGDITSRTLSESVGVLRVIDAASNRGREGLRAVEDYVRFILDDRHLTHLCKRMRHDLREALGHVSVEHRLAARETQADVGTVLATPSERRRACAADVLTANLTRLQEALRSLEEFGKLIDADMGAKLKQLRYQSYTLQRAVEITHTSRERLDCARLYVLINGCGSAEAFRKMVMALIEGGADVIQLRDKRLDDAELVERARLLHELTAESLTLFVMNDRPDLATLAQADGVHIGQDELSVKDVRTLVGPEMLIGVSTHSIDQARRAVLDGANYIGTGPTFPSSTKEFEHFPGLDLLRAVAAEIRLPAFAIGGINVDNVADVLATGFRRIAVSGAVTGYRNPSEATRRLREQLRPQG